MSKTKVLAHASPIAGCWAIHFATLATLQGWPVAFSLMLALVGTAGTLAVFPRQ